MGLALRFDLLVAELEAGLGDVQGCGQDQIECHHLGQDLGTQHLPDQVDPQYEL